MAWYNSGGYHSLSFSFAMKFVTIVAVITWIGARTISPVHGQQQEKEECCSSDFVSCRESSSWCAQSASNCQACGSFWMIPQDPAVCTRQWDWCESSTSCCNGMSCVHYPTYTGCGVVGVDVADISHLVLEKCCTHDFATCSESVWCNESQENCAVCGTSSWQTVDPNAICTPRWEWCQSSDDCCAEMICLDYETYTGCGIDGTDGAFPNCCTWD